jgi:putative heme-binding domain-containing protein
VAADLLGHALYWHDLTPDGSSFRSSHGGELLLANDTWFAPCDVTTGPDGSVYVADWFDKRTAHPDPDADWDRSNGRVYKIEYQGTKPVAPFDLARLGSAQLVALLGHRNDWYARKAREILTDRRDPEAILPLRTLVRESQDDRLALQALWALYVSGGFTEGFAAECLGHRNPHVRRWAVRFLGDDRKVSAALGRRLIDLATSEPDVSVRSQLASTARRLPARDGLPIVERILLRNLDGNDPHLPLLLWWAVEEHAVTARERVLETFASAVAWQAPLVREVILERLMRRYAAEGTEGGYTACARLLASAPGATERGRLLAALDQGLQERPPGKSIGPLFAEHAVVERPSERRPPRPDTLPPALEAQLAALWRDDTTDATLIRLFARLGRPAAQERAVALAVNPRTPQATRLRVLELLAEVSGTASAGRLPELLDEKGNEAVQLAALAALQRFEGEEVAAAILRRFPRMSARTQARASEVLLGSKGWARASLREVDAGRLTAKDVSIDSLRLVALHKDRRLDDLVRKHWGAVQPGTAEEKLAEVRRLSNDLRAGAGDAAHGRELFRQHCATCHRLFGEGEQVGPDLTHANRKDRDYLLVSTVDPSAVIRKEYLSYTVRTTDGRVLTGLLVEQTPGAVTLLSAKNERTRIARGKIESLEESPVSLMPEDLLKGLKPQEVRDLFRYLQSDRPPVGPN